MDYILPYIIYSFYLCILYSGILEFVIDGKMYLLQMFIYLLLIHYYLIVLTFYLHKVIWLFFIFILFIVIFINLFTILHINHLHLIYFHNSIIMNTLIILMTLDCRHLFLIAFFLSLSKLIYLFLSYINNFHNFY
jgi:hypothetical protein